MVNSKERKLWSIHKELITGVHSLLISSVVLRKNKAPESIPVDSGEYSQAFEDWSNRCRESIPDDLREWFRKYSQTFEDWSMKLREISYPDAAGLTGEQQCQKMIDALQGFESVMGESNKLVKDYVAGGKEDFFPGGISRWLSNFYEHYRNLQRLLQE